MQQQAVLKGISTLALLMVSATVAHAQSAVFAPYEDFNARSGAIDIGKWFESEQSRSIKNKELNLMQRAWGGSPTGGRTAVGHNENFRNGSSITAMRAKVTVNAIEANACPDAGAAPAQARARLVGGFFNTIQPGGLGNGSAVGDVIGQIYLRRTSDSTDPAGILQIQAFATLCADPACLTGPIINDQTVDFGTIKVGHSTVLQMEWDSASGSFYFSRDGANVTQVSYAGVVSDAGAPSNAFRQLSTRLQVPNCTSVRVSNMIDASFDDVFVNAQ
jgi:hypothetical protein